MPACLWYLNFAPIDPENRRNKKRLGLFQAPRQDHRHCKEAQGKPMTEKDLVREFDEISAKFAAARRAVTHPFLRPRSLPKAPEPCRSRVDARSDRTAISSLPASEGR